MLKRKLPSWIIISLVLVATQAVAQEYPLTKTSARGYATYRNFQTFENLASNDPFWTSQMDINEVELRVEYYLSATSEIELELEIEHGGTGTAIEYDHFEEFGEFENEVEKGGEVVLSEFYYRYFMGNLTWLKVGKVPVWISLANIQEKYHLYPSIDASGAELYMLPSDWREIGVSLQKYWGGWQVYGAIVNGLNSEFFRSYNWVGGGYQTQFETVNANDLAINALVQYGDLSSGRGVAAGVYYGETSGNRHKRNKVNGSGSVLIYSLLGAWKWQNFGVRFQSIYGQLENSTEIVSANGDMGTLLNPGAFSSIGSEAQLNMLQATYTFLLEDGEITPFVSYQHVNTMKEVASGITADARYDQLITGGGVMWRFAQASFLKFQYQNTSTAQSDLPDTRDYALAYGFDLDAFQ